MPLTNSIDCYNGSLFEWLFPLALVMLLGYQQLAAIALLSGAMLVAFSGSFIETPIIVDAIKRNDSPAARQAYLKLRGFRVKLGSTLGVIATLIFSAVLYSTQIMVA